MSIETTTIKFQSKDEFFEAFLLLEKTSVQFVSATVSKLEIVLLHQEPFDEDKFYEKVHRINMKECRRLMTDWGYGRITN